MPKAVAGQLEIRLLPPANRLKEDYIEWLGSDPCSKVRLYQTTIWPSNQVRYEVRQAFGDSPGGAGYWTFISFVHQTTNGEYFVTWMGQGRLKGDFLRVTREPRAVLLQPHGEYVPDRPLRLQIAGFEGIEPQGVVVATPGYDPKPTGSKP